LQASQSSQRLCKNKTGRYGFNNLYFGTIQSSLSASWTVANPDILMQSQLSLAMNPPRLRQPHPTLISACVGLALAAPAILLATGFGASGPVATTPVPSAAAGLGVHTLTVEPAPGFDRRRIYTGRVESFRHAALGFERAGLLQEVLVREGDPVRAGQVLARLDSALLKAKRAELQATLRTAEADLSLAQATLTRYQGSVDQGAVTRQALDEAREGARSAAAGLELARARIASADLDITKSVLTAPFDGVVTRRDADEGRVLGAGEPVLRVQEEATPEIRVGVAGRLADTLHPGTDYRLTWRGGTFDARLRAVLPVREGAARTVDALFVPTDPEAIPGSVLRPGELVELQLSQRIEEPGFWLPLNALTEGSRGLWSAYAVEPPRVEAAAAEAREIGEDAGGGRLAVRPLEVLYQDRDRVFVRGPLAAGETLVAAGLHRVVPGQLVRILGAREVQLADRRSSAEGH
jgi:RND family efflux transporter MFP subunit